MRSPSALLLNLGKATEVLVDDLKTPLLTDKHPSASPLYVNLTTLTNPFPVVRVSDGGTGNVC